MMPVEIGRHLTIDPRTGKPVFKGTRLTVETVLKRLARGWTFKELLRRSPKLTHEAIEEAVNLAAEALLAKYADEIEAARKSAWPDCPAERAIPPFPIGRYIVIDPRICSGQMTFDGTRVPVETVLAYIAKGTSVADVPKGWPRVTPAAARKALESAAAALAEQSEGRSRVADEPAYSRRAN